MTTTDLIDAARALVADGKGLLAADETVSTLTRRFSARTISSTPESRRTYREMFFTTPGIDAFISGVILHDETIRQSGADGTPLPDLLARRGIVPGIKVDLGAKLLAGCPGEQVTEGLDGLAARLEEYRNLGARFAKWRAVLSVSHWTPSPACIHANAHALARYAAISQEQGMVPIVEPEVLMDGAHTIERCEQVTEQVLHAVFDALFEQRVMLEGILLKPNMVIPGRLCAQRAQQQEVAAATGRCLRRQVPAAVPGIVFLSGGQDPRTATAHLNAINQLEGARPWKITFSYGRALQDEALVAWGGKSEHLGLAQRAFHHRAMCDAAAARGRYTTSMEIESAAA
jgi:fructose-bisphosphate aldolase class I